MIKILFLTSFIVLMSCANPIKNQGSCQSYKPVTCLYMSDLVCEINSMGCETCSCVDFNERSQLFQKKQ